MQKLPVIISSAKPFDGGAYDNLQRRAINSWREVTDHRLMFNDAEEIECLGDGFYRTEDTPPTIKEMLEVAISCGHQIVAIVNSDIVLTPKILKVFDVTAGDRLGSLWAATSFRYEMDGKIALGITGQGLDCFIMTKRVVQEVLKDVSPIMTIGRGLWDNWLNGWLRRNIPSGRYFNMTPWECVFHNVHEREPNRLPGYTDDQVGKIMSSGHLSAAGIPPTIYL